ncbi:MAG: uncharacterized protein PWP04_789 [Candidatus Atribacteria bacterium]|nr:uncharacterized protein [Candidatus Atribacteria bacterium]
METEVEKKEIFYFSKAGKENTSFTLDLAVERGKAADIPFIVVATRSGETAFLLADKAKKAGYNGSLVAVTYHAGFLGEDRLSLPPSKKEELEKLGVTVVISSHALSGVNRSFRQKFGGVSIPEVIAESYRRISEGFKVAIEIAIMAADGGAIPTDREVISLGGTGRGVDTGLVIKAAHQNSFFDLKVKEIFCYPK